MTFTEAEWYEMIDGEAPEHLRAVNGAGGDGGEEPPEDEGQSYDSEQEEPRGVAPGPDLDDFLATVDEEYDWIVPGILERGDRLIVTGPEGGGKSTLLRQFGVQCAAGVHPFDGPDMAPLRVLYVDCENSRRQVRRKLRPLRISAGSRLERHQLAVIVKPDGLNLANALDREWLELRIEANRPDLLLIGPLYKLADGDPTEEKVAKPVALCLDAMRERWHFAIVIEAHSPHATGNGRRPERPYGWSGWLRWPEFGLYLDKDGPLRHWRGARDEREFPVALRRGGEWPWTVETRGSTVTFARIIEETRKAGHKLSLRQYADVIGGSKDTIDRAMKANQIQFDQLCSEITKEAEF